MTDIRELDATTVERIAAGEVVERPSSVVKELVENSLDADAGRIDVRVDAAGTDSIRVSDDGIGMTEDELRRAIEEHTTSKIRDIADLEGGVGTLGFRGEALHAIGAVSRTTITTRPRADRAVDDARGTELTVEGGEVTDVSPAGCPEGTTVAVRDLFYNVPARRKYLKQESTEFAHVNTVVTNYALANPEVAVSLSHGDRETFATTGQGDRREAVMSVYGREVAGAMLDVDGDAMPDGPLDGVTGLVSHPETNRASRDYLSTFVNGRYVTASAVREAIVEAYGAQLASDRYPFAVVDLSVDPGTVDVNVHPRKLEVRFADEAAVRDQIRTAVEETLLAEGLVRSTAPRGRSAADEATIRPGNGSGESGGEPAGSGDSGGRSSGASHRSRTEQESEPHQESGAGGRSGTSPNAQSGAADSESLATDAQPSTGSDARTGGRSSTDTESATGRSRPAAAGRKFTADHDQQRLGGTDGDADARTFDSLPSMRVLGQFRDTYVVAETDEGLVLIDQHAADERINYERLKARFDGETTTQALAEPVELELTAREADLFAGHADALARLGFRAELVDDRTVEVRSVPSLVAEAAGPELVRDVLAGFISGEDAAAGTVEQAADDLLADLACYPSITGNTSLTEGSVVDLLDRLDDCENPYACPHGRPVIVEIDDGELEDRFERDYPGHGG
jgi:DNA mismatch repair protein MutL